MAGLLELLSMAQKQPQTGSPGSTMRAIPQDTLLSGLSSGLGAVRDFGNKLNVPYLGGVGDMFVGKSPEEIENWSYGNSPFQTTEMGLPQIKEERKQGLLDAISALAPVAKMTKGMPVGMSVAPMGMTVKNTNADLLKKYLSTGKLSPKEMAEYEANGLAMETPQLQRYNVANAMANPEMQAYKDTLNMPVYHGTNDVITAPDYAFSGKGADQLGSSALYTSAQPSLASGFANPDISGGNVLPLVLRNTNKYMSDELEKKLTPAQIREFITKSPDEDALWNFGDVGYEGKNKVINTAVQGYHQYGDEKLLDTLNTLNNDFYRGNPEEFNKLAEKLTKKAGVVMDTGENKIYATWNPKDIRSRFAAFDPLRKNSSSLLASGLLGSLLLNNEMKNSENR